MKAMIRQKVRACCRNKMVSQRIAGVPIEANGIVAIPEEPDDMDANQSPHAFREELAPLLGLEEENLLLLQLLAVVGPKRRCQLNILLLQFLLCSFSDP